MEVKDVRETIHCQTDKRGTQATWLFVTKKPLFDGRFFLRQTRRRRHAGGAAPVGRRALGASALTTDVLGSYDSCSQSATSTTPCHAAEPPLPQLLDTPPVRSYRITLSMAPRSPRYEARS